MTDGSENTYIEKHINQIMSDDFDADETIDLIRAQENRTNILCKRIKVLEKENERLAQELHECEVRT
jgi:hypothetical protein